MKRHHSSYDNVQIWAVRKTLEGLEVYPTLRSPALMILCMLPLFVGFGYVVELVPDRIDRRARLLWWAIALGTPVLMSVIVFIKWRLNRDGGRNFIEIDAARGRVKLPRAGLEFDATSPDHRFVHDHFRTKRSHYSEFNLLHQSRSGTDTVLILKSLGPYRPFDKLGAQLEEHGIAFERREITDED